MGSVRKASAWLGLVDDNDDERYYDDDYSEGTEQPGDAWVTDPRVKVASDTAEEKGRRIGTVTPDSFRYARAIRELFRQGRITGVLRDDPFGAEDAQGPLLCDAERLRLRRSYALQMEELNEQAPPTETLIRI